MRPEAPDELEAGLQKRDRIFLLRLLLRFTVVALLAIWGLAMLGESNVGGCAARGFESLTSAGGP